MLAAFAAALLYRRRFASSRVLAFSTVAMFLLATVQLAARLRATANAFQVFYLAVQGEFAPQSRVASDAMARYIGFNFAEDILLVTNKYVLFKSVSTSF